MKTLDPVWAAYKPSDEAPWDLRRVVHLHRRAGFAGTWAELQRDLKDGPDASIDRLLAGKASLHSPAEFDSTADLLGRRGGRGQRAGPAQGVVVLPDAVRPGPARREADAHVARPLRHQHRQGRRTSAAMRRQNDTFRKHGRATFGDLLNAVVREPALLVCLDAPANRKGHPNENLGRELMELFTLGVGHYTEADVKEAARCLTGWTVEDGKFAEVADPARRRREDGPRQEGQVDRRRPGARCCSNSPATAKRLAWRLCDVVLRREGGVARGDEVAGRRAARATTSTSAGRSATILRSRRSSPTPTSRTRVMGPAEFVVGAARALELFDPAPSTLALADWCGRMGQDLFEPPNVGGWPGGRAWVGARA